MEIFSKSSAPRYRRQEGITSYLLASPRTSGAKHLTTTLVQVEPGGEQRIHRHEPEQVYFIVEGSGQMTVGAESQDVAAGDCVFVPSNAPHGLRNSGQTVLRYFSAAAPAFDADTLRSIWPLPGEGEK